MKYSDLLGEWLKALGYTHYFYVGGGNIMHLTESLDKHLIGIPVVHEVAAGVAAEYFNEVSQAGIRALALVTTGPGITNIVTATAGAWLESRELLVIGGQVKVSDLANGEVRSRGIQEIDGVSLMSSITKKSVQVREPLSAEQFYELVSETWQPRKGPVFLEIPLNVQAIEVEHELIEPSKELPLPRISDSALEIIVSQYNESQRPILLIGGGVSHDKAKTISKIASQKEIPVMTTYNGADRCDGDAPNYLGRPNTWGQRSSNIIIQRSDLIIAIGTRLGLQQTGFNWAEFGRDANIIQVDIDEKELAKGHPKIDKGLAVDADNFLDKFLSSKINRKTKWLDQCRAIRNEIPRVEDVNYTSENYISPYDFLTTLESFTTADDLIIPCSSGSAFTLTMQLYKQKLGQRVITNKSLASMGYGLSGAIGAAIARNNKSRTILIEGDGGFAQNMQEMGTAEINNLNLKIFIFNDQGHASIRMTQQNYFKGKYLGCDRTSGLGLPNWYKLFNSWDIECTKINRGFECDAEFITAMNRKGLHVFIVEIDPKQTYYPKISSKVMEDGSMCSNPIDEMTPKFESMKLDFKTT